MSKVPVGKSIAHAYEFLFGRFFQIIGTAWLPALLYATGYYFWLKNAAGWMAPLTADHALLFQGIAASLGIAALSLIVRSIIGISLTQEALGVRKDLALAHFVIGPRELRLFFAQIRLILLILVLDIVVVAVIVLGVGAANKYGAAIAHVPQVGGKSLVVVAALVAAVLIYIAFALTVLKLSFLLTAVASVEHRASIRQAWQLAGGSGWRILAVLIGTFLPLAVIVCGAVYALAGADLSAAMQAVHAAGADHVKRSHAMLQFYSDHAMLLSVVFGIVAIVGGALMAGATASAYRTVTGHEEEEPEDDSALVAPLIAGHDDHGHGGGHDDHGHGGGHDDHGHGGGHDDHGHGGGHDDHGHGGGDDDHGHGGGHDDHGHGGGHDDHGHGGGHDDHGHGGGHDDHGHGGGHDDHGHGGGHDDHAHGGHGHDDHGHGHDDHGHGGHGDGHHHHARAA